MGPGKWQSFAVMDDGYVLCGSGSAHINSLAKRVIKIGCA